MSGTRPSPERSIDVPAIGPRLAGFAAATFAAVGVQLPFWLVWLQSRGLNAAEIGLVLAAAFWPRIVTNLLIALRADRVGQRKPLMMLLAIVTLAALALIGTADQLWQFLVLSAVSGAAWAALGPLGEALTLQELQRSGIAYGRVRLWGSLTFILAAVGTGRLIERQGDGVILGLLLLCVVLTIIACILLPETRSGRPVRNRAAARRAAAP